MYITVARIKNEPSPKTINLNFFLIFQLSTASFNLQIFNIASMCLASRFCWSQTVNVINVKLGIYVFQHDQLPMTPAI